jgi:hypothetical protein
MCWARLALDHNGTESTKLPLVNPWWEQLGICLAISTLALLELFVYIIKKHPKMVGYDQIKQSG